MCDFLTVTVAACMEVVYAQRIIIQKGDISTERHRETQNRDLQAGAPWYISCSMGISIQIQSSSWMWIDLTSMRLFICALIPTPIVDNLLGYRPMYMHID